MFSERYQAAAAGPGSTRHSSFNCRHCIPRSGVAFFTTGSAIVAIFDVTSAATFSLSLPSTHVAVALATAIATATAVFLTLATAAFLTLATALSALSALSAADTLPVSYQ